MIFSLFKRRGDPTADSLYASIVAQARQPAFYLDFAVADTVDGRFDMIVLHLALVIERLKDGDATARECARNVSETFFSDMDRSLREMGVGDLSVPKKVRKMADAFYGRVKAYEAGLATDGDEDLVAALKRNIWPDAENASAPAKGLAGYVRAAAAVLADMPSETVIAGEVVWPNPAAFFKQDASS
ncbi:MAG: ubiquinol-cytochrome C chaperone [Hyphomicrobiales bacterium]|nr:MAG: ubiquinol-cytochrome C chaperone [Hyphomicrobiales bacterium]